MGGGGEERRVKKGWEVRYEEESEEENKTGRLV